MDKKGELYFSADLNKYEYLFHYIPNTNQLFKSKRCSSSIKHLQVKNNTLYFDFLSKNGTRIGKIHIDDIKYRSFHFNESSKIEPINHYPVSIQAKSYNSKRPRIKFHSIIPIVSYDNTQIQLIGNDFLRKNYLSYTFYKSYGSNSSVHQLSYKYTHYPVHISTGFQRSNSGTRNLYLDNYIIPNFEENKIPINLSFPINLVKSGYTLSNIINTEWSYRYFNSSLINKNIGKYRSAFQFENQLFFSKNKTNIALQSPLFVQINTTYTNDFKKGYLFECRINSGINILNNEHFINAAFGYSNENTEKNIYRFRKQMTNPSRGYFLNRSSLGNSIEAQQIFLSPEVFHYKLNTKHTLGYPNIRFTDYIFIKRFSVSPFYELSHYYFDNINQHNIASLGFNFDIDIQWLKSVPVKLQITYANRLNVVDNSSYFGFGFSL